MDSKKPEEFVKFQPHPMLQPTELVMLKLDGATPSGVRLAVPLGSSGLQIRYSLKGTDHSFFFASSLLDLVAQTTREARALNGKMFVMDRWQRLVERMAVNFYSSDRLPLKKLLEQELNILIADQ